MKLRIVLLCAATLLGAGSIVQAQSSTTVYGLKSLGTGVPSLPPTVLFQFAADGSNFAQIGNVQIGGADIDADGLAASSVFGLLAFERSGGGSRLISLSATDATATVVGNVLAGRDIRGATFALDGTTLYALDAASDALLTIDPTTGAVTSTVTLSSALDDSSDIAFTRDGTLYLTDYPTVDALDPFTGQRTTVFSDSGLQAPGLAFATVGGTERALVYDVAGSDDIFGYDTPDFTNQTLLYGNIVGSFNSGRGDLATVSSAATAPEPATGLLLLPVAAMGLATRVRRRRK